MNTPLTTKLQKLEKWADQEFLTQTLVIDRPHRHAPMRTRIAGSSLAHVFFVSVRRL